MLRDIVNWIWTAKPEWESNMGSSGLDEAEKNLLIDIVQEELDELKLALEIDDRDGIKDACIDIIWTTMNSIAACGIPILEFEYYSKSVSKSNWSKFCHTKFSAEHSCFLYSVGQHPTKFGKRIQTYYKKVGNQYVIFRTKDNKIMKSATYVEPMDTLY